ISAMPQLAENQVVELRCAERSSRNLEVIGVVMHLESEVIAPNAVVLLMDPSVGVVPDNMSGRAIAVTSSCVALGALSDGPTRIMLSDELSETDVNEVACDVVLETPSQRLAVCSVLVDVIVEMAVKAERTRVRIWTNDEIEPSDLRIVVYYDDDHI